MTRKERETCMSRQKSNIDDVREDDVPRSIKEKTFRERVRNS